MNAEPSQHAIAIHAAKVCNIVVRPVIMVPVRTGHPDVHHVRRWTAYLPRPVPAIN